MPKRIMLHRFQISGPDRSDFFVDVSKSSFRHFRLQKKKPATAVRTVTGL